MFFTHRTFSIFVPLVVFLGCHSGSLLQKYDPDKCEQNSNKSRLCFFSHQALSTFASLAVPWGAILDPCGKSVILASTCAIQINVVYGFFTHQAFSIFAPLTATWDPILDPCCKRIVLASIRKTQVNVVCAFCPSDIFHFGSF